MVSDLTERPPSVGEARERMQRVRVGVTGLAAVLLIVALATAIATGVRRSATEPVMPGNAAITANEIDPHAEPLAQLGVAPGGKDVGGAPEKRSR